MFRIEYIACECEGLALDVVELTFATLMLRASEWTGLTHLELIVYLKVKSC